jgi:hypothetical protein
MVRCAVALALMIVANPVFAGGTKTFEAIDQHALKAPPEAEESLAKLAEYLSQPCKTDKDKARVIFRWIADRISYDAESFFSGKRGDNSPDGVRVSRKCVCEGYANLFVDLSTRMGLKAVKVHGVAKGIDYVSTAKAARPNHAWNAVYFEEKWWLLDPTWGAGSLKGKDFIKKLREFYFLTPPDLLIISHFPQDPKWQLLDAPLTAAQFDQQPKVDPGLWALGVSPATVRAQINDQAVKEFVRVLTYTGPALTLVNAPLRKNLEAGKEYKFHFKSDGLAAMSVLHDGQVTFFKKTGNDFQLNLVVRKGRLVVGGSMPTQKNHAAFLEYFVE